MAFNKTCLKEDILPRYTDIKTHDPAARDQHFTKDYRRKLIEFQVSTQEKTWSSLQAKLDRLQEQLSNCEIDQSLLNDIHEALDIVIERTNHATKVRTVKKLSKLYGGQVMLPEAADGYINLSEAKLSECQKQVLNLGLNCHIQRKVNIVEKQADLELLFQDIKKLESDKKVITNDRLKDQLVGESA